MTTIKEMKEDKHLLMHNIEVLLNEFQDKHGIEAGAISMYRDYTVGAKYQRLIVQDIEVKL